MYGARGANGVILVTTKKGEEGSVYTTARYEVVVSRPTKEIDVVDPITYMKMYNQAIMGRSNAGVPNIVSSTSTVPLPVDTRLGCIPQTTGTNFYSKTRALTIGQV